MSLDLTQQQAAPNASMQGDAGTGWKRFVAHPRKPLSPLALAALAVLLGVFAGVGAFGFRMLIAFFHNLFFFRELSMHYDSNQHTPLSVWGLGMVAIPAVGAMAVVFLVKNFAPEAKGHGVPEVMDAIYYNKGVIRPVVAAVKSSESWPAPPGPRSPPS